MTIHSTIAQIEALHSAAGKWPSDPVPDGIVSGYYECPACNGEGSVDAELVSRMHAGLVGVQVYGIGDQMAAMEKLLPLMIESLPSLIAYIRALEKVRDAARAILDYGDLEMRAHIEDRQRRDSALRDAIYTLDSSASSGDGAGK